MDEPNWTEVEVDEALLARRAAMLEIVERNGGYSSDPHFSFSKLCRTPLPWDADTYLWEFVWQERFGEVAGFAVSGASALHLLDLSASIERQYGLKHRWRLEDWQVALILNWSSSRLDQFEGRQALGRDAHWNGAQMLLDPAGRIGQFELRVEPEEFRWTPADLDPATIESERLRQRYIQLCEAADEYDDARARAEEEYRSRDRTGWRTIFDPAADVDAEGEKLGERFFELARATFLGFQPPGKSDPVALRAKPMPCYGDAVLVSMFDGRGSHPRESRFLMAAGEEGSGGWISAVQRVSQTLHDLNARLGVSFTLDAVPCYIELFCGNIEATEGSFSVVESPEDLQWKGSDPGPREKLRKILSPLIVWNCPGVPVTDENGLEWYLATCFICNGDNLFFAVMVLSSSGEIAMVHDQPIAFNLPIVRDKITEKTAFVYVERATS